jgi:predicted transcriptional regulator YdeE
MQAPDLALCSLDRDLTIIGCATRTRPEAAASDIPALWQRFRQEGVAARLQASDAFLYALYCDYESDHRGAYTMVLGVACAADAPVPEGMRRVRVPAGRFARFPVAGNPAEVVWKAWAYINGEGAGAWGRGVERRYIADFERYAKISMTEAEADLCVGLLQP